MHIFKSPYTQVTSATSILFGRGSTKVSKSPVWLFLGTTDVYQNFYSCQQGSTRDNGSTAMQYIPGTDGGHTEIPTKPSSINKILGVSDQFQLNVHQLAITEGQEDPTGSSKTPEVI